MAFKYTAEMRDSDASNARSAAFRIIRDSQEWDDDAQPLQYVCCTRFHLVR